MEPQNQFADTVVIGAGMSGMTSASELSRAGLALLEAAAPWLRSGVTEFQTHGWLYSKPLQVYEEACAVLHTRPHLVMAGAAFAGPKVEGAAHSGWAAAGILLD